MRLRSVVDPGSGLTPIAPVGYVFPLIPTSPLEGRPTAVKLLSISPTWRSARTRESRRCSHSLLEPLIRRVFTGGVYGLILNWRTESLRTIKLSWIFRFVIYGDEYLDVSGATLNTTRPPTGDVYERPRAISGAMVLTQVLG